MTRFLLFLNLFCQVASFSAVERKSSAVSGGGTDGADVRRAIIVGGGPAGLATALTLASQPHNYQVSVIESSALETSGSFDASKAYLYNINLRGRAFTDKFSSVHDRLMERSVVQQSMFFKSFAVVSADPETKIEAKAMGQIDGKGIGKLSFWLPRHEMVKILQEAVADCSSDINLLCNHEFLSVKPNSVGGDGKSELTVRSRNLLTGEEIDLDGTLVVGADGVNSNVREYLSQDGGRCFEEWECNPRKFEAIKKHSPAVGLRIKALQMPPHFSITDSDGSLYVTHSETSYAIRSKNSSPRSYLGLGLLPMKNNEEVRPANFITRPNHELWNIRTGQEMRDYCAKAFPRLNFETDAVSDEEWTRFAKSEGTRFPHCQFSPGLQISSSNGSAGIALLGDAIHAFPPDIGQGVNAAYEDVNVLDKHLVASSKGTATLGEALMSYEKERGPEAKAIIKLAQCGAPYQYKQPLRVDRLRRSLYLCNIMLRVILNKLTFGVLPKPAIMLAADPSLKFTQVMRRADSLTALLTGCLGLLVYRLFRKMFHL